MFLPPHVLHEGQTLLAQLLPQAREMAARNPVTSAQLSEQTVAMLRLVTEDNLAAVLIHRGELGGWHCNVLLRQAPAGVPAAFGTRPEAPLPTRAAAEAAAAPLLAGALAMGAWLRATTPPPRRRVFVYFGQVVELPEPALAATEATAAMRPDLRYRASEEARDRIDRITDELFPGGKVTPELLRALPRESRARLTATLVTAAVTGIGRYPEPSPAPPAPRPPT